MNLYLLSQNENCGYDRFISCVVCAETEDDAKTIEPDFDNNRKPFKPNNIYGTWAFTIDGIHCEYIGVAAPHLSRGVIIHSLYAG